MEINYEHETVIQLRVNKRTSYFGPNTHTDIRIDNDHCCLNVNFFFSTMLQFILYDYRKY